LLKAPAPPAIAPLWGVAMMRDLVAWVWALAKQPARLPSYRAADLPNAADWYSAALREGRSAMIFVSDETGGPVPAFTDGVNWRRVTDRNIVS
jgi:hypothetical protein